MVERGENEKRVREEEDAAAQEAAGIGGRGSEQDVPEEQRPVVEGGGGEAEGFERSEEELVEGATHGDPAPDPTELAGEPEEERGDAEYGEPDRVNSTERIEEGEEGRS